jgi:hypothetical protein
MILFNNRVKTKKQMNPVKIYWGVKKNPRKKKSKKKEKNMYTHTQPLNNLMHSFNYKEYVYIKKYIDEQLTP